LKKFREEKEVGRQVEEDKGRSGGKLG